MLNKSPSIPLKLLKRRQKALDLEIRVVDLIDLCSLQIAAEDWLKLPTEVSDFLDDIFDTEVHPSLQPIVEAFIGNPTQADATLENLLDMHPAHAGLLVKFSTPVRFHFDQNAWRAGWSISTTGWVAAPTFDAAWKLGCEWAKARHAKDLDKFLKGKKSSEGGTDAQRN